MPRYTPCAAVVVAPMLLIGHASAQLCEPKPETFYVEDGSFASTATITTRPPTVIAEGVDLPEPDLVDGFRTRDLAIAQLALVLWPQGVAFTLDALAWTIDAHAIQRDHALLTPGMSNLLGSIRALR